MTAQNDRKVVEEYSDWEQGDSFGAGLDDVSGNPKSAYQAMNMQVYTNGSLGVRPWLKLIEPGAGSTTLGSGSTAPSRGYSWGWVDADYTLVGDFQGWLYFNNNQDPAFYQPVGGPGTWEPAAAPVGHLGSIRAVRENDNNTQDFLPINPDQTVVGGDGVMDVDAPSFTAFTHAAGFDPDRAVIYKSRMYVWGDASDPYRVHFSDNTGFDDLATTTNFFDLSVAGQTGGVRVEGGYSTSDALMFYRSDGVWNALTGASPETGVVREIGPARIPDWYKSATVYKNRVMFLATEGLGLTSMTPQGADYGLDIVRPRGVQRNQLASSDERIETREALTSFTYDSVHFFFERRNSEADTEQIWNSGVKSIDYVNDAFNMSGYFMLREGDGFVVPNWFTDQRDVYGITMMMDRVITFCVDGTGDPETVNYVPVLYTRDITLDRPSRADDRWSGRTERLNVDTSLSHRSNGEVRLRKVQAGDGNRVRIRRVIVDATYWKDTSNTNWYPAAMSAQVIADGNTQNMTNNDFDQSALATTGFEGRPVRLVFLNGAVSFSNEVGLVLHNIQTMAIRKVTVEYEYERYLERP